MESISVLHFSIRQGQGALLSIENPLRDGPSDLSPAGLGPYEVVSVTLWVGDGARVWRFGCAIERSVSNLA